MNTAPFQIGQKVVALSTRGDGYNSIHEGDEYTVLDIMKGCNHAAWIVDIGKVQDAGYTNCTQCGFRINGNAHWISAKHFAPLKEQSKPEVIYKVIHVDRTISEQAKGLLIKETIAQ